MSLYKFTEIIPFSNSQIYEEIDKIDKELFTLRLKKATRQYFKSHQFKKARCRLAQLKTLLTLRKKNLNQI